MFTQYKDMKLGWFWMVKALLRVTQNHLHNHSIQCIWFPIWLH